MMGIITNVIAALVIAIVAFGLGSFAKSKIEKLSEKSDRFDITLTRFFGSLVRYAIIALAVIFILGRFGIETTSLAALVGAAGLAVGLALQGTLSHVASGVMLIGFRPFKVGDYVDTAGQSGTVTAVTLFTTELTTPDNVQIIIPNGDVFSSAITNYSFHNTRRVDLVFGVSYGADLKKAEQIITACIEDDARSHDTPEPFVKVSNLGDSSVDFTVRVWCNAADYWDLKFDLTRAVKDAFDEGDVEIPFPTQTIIRQDT